MTLNSQQSRTRGLVLSFGRVSTYPASGLWLMVCVQSDSYGYPRKHQRSINKPGHPSTCAYVVSVPMVVCSAPNIESPQPAQDIWVQTEAETHLKKLFKLALLC